jgi:hypothetical protein
MAKGISVTRKAASIYSLPFCGIPGTGNFAPADAGTYYIGSLFGVTPQTTGALSRVYVPPGGAGTIVGVTMLITNNSATATNETSSMWLRLNDTTDYVLTTTLDLSGGAPQIRNVSATVAIPVVAGDYFEIKWTTPTWVTNPAAVRISGNALIQ